MAASCEISMERWLDVALNPIGSLALVERFDENTASLLRTFNILSQKVVDLIISPYGFRIVESFLTVDEVYVRLAESLSEKWNGFEKVLKTEKGRYVCETLLKKKMKLFAHKIITIAPRDWWFKNVEALTILIKAITFSDIDIAKDFIFHEQMVVDLCDTPEGLYCVLKVISKLIDQPGWKNALADLIIFKSQSVAGCEALSQAILYGDYLVNEVIEIICCHRESFDSCTTVSLIIRLIEQGSSSMKELIVNCLCEPHGNPVICQIRKTAQFELFKKACDSNFTPPQRKRLEDCMPTTRVRSVVDDCITTSTANVSDSMNTPDGHSKKRRRESHVTSKSSAKKPREEVAKPHSSASKTTVLAPSTVSIPSDIPTVSTVARRPMVTAPSTIRTVSTQSTMASAAATVPLPPTVLPPHTVTTQSTIASSATVPIPSTTPSVKPRPSPTVSPTIPPVAGLKTMSRIDPGMDVINMAMSEKYRVLLSKLAKGTLLLRSTVFNCIRNALLALMMHEKGSEVVKWFIVNGTSNQKEEIERKVEENLEDLVTNGGYGRAVALLSIDNCADSEKKKELIEKSVKAMESRRDPCPSTLDIDCDEVEIIETTIDKMPAAKSTVAKIPQPAVNSAIGEPVNQPIDKQSDERNTVAKKIDMQPDQGDTVAEKIDMQPDQGDTVAKVSGTNENRSRAPEASTNEANNIRKWFDQVEEKMRQGDISSAEYTQFSKRAVQLVKDDTSRLFAKLVEERVADWVMDECGVRLFKRLVEKRPLQPHLVYAVVSVLHIFQSSYVLNMMVTKNHRIRLPFVDYCVARHADSPLVKLFHTNMPGGYCLWIAQECAKTNPQGVRALLSSDHGRSIADTVNGRMFIELLKNLPPVGLGWTDLCIPEASPPLTQPPQGINTDHDYTVAVSQQNTVTETTVPSGVPSVPAIPHSLSAQNFPTAVNKPAFDTP